MCVCVGGYSYIRTAWVCATRKLPPASPPHPQPPPPHFLALAAPIDATFASWAAPKGPLFKNIQFFVPLLRPGQIEKILVLKTNYVSLLFLAPISRFSVSSRSETPPPPFSVRGHSQAHKKILGKGQNGRSVGKQQMNNILRSAYVFLSALPFVFRRTSVNPRVRASPPPGRNNWTILPTTNCSPDIFTVIPPLTFSLPLTEFLLLATAASFYPKPFFPRCSSDEGCWGGGKPVHVS